MARSVTNILQTVITIVKKGGGDKEAIKGLADIKKTAGDVAMVAGAIAGAWYTVDKALDATVGEMVRYAEQVRTIQNATGASAEDSSKLIQILDDQKISYEQFTKAVTKGGKTYDYTIDGIANMSDEFLRLGDVNDQAAYAQERFGKQWQSFIPILQKGKQGILDAANAVEGSLVLTQEGVDQAREYEMAMDQWNDSVMALKISIGTELLPTMTKMMVGFANSSDIREEANRLMMEGVAGNREEALAMASAMVQQEAYAEAMQKSNAALDENTESAADNKAAQEQLKEEMDALNLLISGPVGDGIDDHISKMNDLRAEQGELNAELSKLKSQGYGPLSDKVQDVTQKINDNRAAIDQENAAWAENARQIVFNLVQRQVLASNLSEAQKSQFIGGLAEKFGLIDENTAAAVTGIGNVIGQLDDGKISTEEAIDALDIYAKKLAALDGTEVNVKVNQVTVQSGSTDYSPGSTNNPYPSYYANGADFIVPQGYPNDGYTMHVESGEHVQVTPANDVRRGEGARGTTIYVENVNLSGDKLRVGKFLEELGVSG